MSSLRPLLTISFLAMVGLFLYMKINETEPVIPEDAAEWDLSADIQIGGEELAIDTGSGDAAASSYGSTASSSATPYGAAPAYSGNTMNEAPPAFQPSTASSAPAFTPEVNSNEAAATEVEIDVPTESPDDQSENADTAAGMAGMPELPSLPPAPVSTPSEKDATEVAETPMNEAPAFQASPSESTQQSSVAPPFVATPQASDATPSIVAETTPTVPATAASEAASANLNLGSRYGSVPVTETTPALSDLEEQSPITPTETFPDATQEAANQPSLFSSARLNVQAALDRGQLSQALLLLSDWYGDPSLSAEESAEVEDLLSQLAGSVIYSTESRLEPPYLVQQGETLTDIAQKHNVPWQLLAKINGIADPSQLQPGQQLKVVKGPFSARVHLEQRKLILMLDRRYAGEFDLEFDPSVTVEEGYWSVSQKLLTPGEADTKSEDRILLLTSTTPGVTQVAVLRASEPRVGSGEDPNRVLKMDSRDVEDVFDILSLGSQVVIRR